MALLPKILFRVEGEAGPFLTQVRRRKIPLCQLREENGAIFGEIPAWQYKALARLARGTGARLRAVRRKGAWFRLRRYRKRLGLLAGAAFFLSALVFSQNFLWAVDIVPTERVTEQQIQDVLKRHGVVIGAYLPGLDLQAAAMLARAELPGAAFFALNRVGSRIQVEVVDAVEAPPYQKETGLCNIVAAENGIIRSVEAYTGQQMVRVGQSVGQGDLLVSGIIENRDGHMLYVHAEAKVMAEVEESRTFSLPLSQTERTDTGEVKTRSRIDLFGKKWPLFIAQRESRPYRSEFSLFELPLGSVRLPVGIEKEELHYFQEEQIRYTEEEALGILTHMAQVYGEELAEKGELLGQESSARLAGGKLELEVTYRLVKDISVPVPIPMPEE